MKLVPLLIFLLALAGCARQDANEFNVSVQGQAVGADFDGTPLVVGEGDLKGRPLLVNYWASW
jgi:hypothetical protein